MHLQGLIGRKLNSLFARENDFQMEGLVVNVCEFK